jgi:hypothetical protein
LCGLIPPVSGDQASDEREKSHGNAKTMHVTFASSPLPEQAPQRRRIDAVRAGDVCLGFPFYDHAPGVDKLSGADFSRTHAALAVVMPALVLSEITLGSNSAMMLTIENTTRPAAVFVSITSMID